MNAEIHAFGEILWDCLPSGRHAGGAPFNVAAHLAQLDVSAALISAVGRDALGDEILQVAREKEVNTRFIDRARAGLPTGTVIATVDAHGNATYEIVQPAAWDEIMVPPEAVEAVARADAFIFGSLAGRSASNREQLNQLLALPGPLKVFDVNLRLPFVEPAHILDLAARADVIKLNEDELKLLANWLRTDAEAVAPACALLADATGTTRICVTMGAKGAAMWERDAPFVQVPAPAVSVRDTVGAGDAFMAALVLGLARGVAPRTILECACRLGAFVASSDGATPLLPGSLVREITQDFGG